VKTDLFKRIDELKVVQEVDKRKGELIMFNQELIEKAITIIRQLIANQLSWDDIWEQIKEAQQKGDPLASQIIALNLIKNRFSMQLE
jgi:predicted ribosome quality control (RQC) complex YloA/Tae2 family protein